MTASLADLQISSASLQYVRVPISEATGGDPTGDPVTFAFPDPAAEPTVFYTGSWSTLNGIYYARCLVGPGGAVQLPAGFYDVYVKVTDSPEIPVLLSGVLEVT
jgi:hypothetical protein